MKSELFYINAIKTIGILSLIVGHCTPNTDIQRYIYSFHMPLFIFVHGYLINYKYPHIDDRKYFFINKTHKFLRIYLISTFLLIFYGIVCNVFGINCFYMRDLNQISNCLFDTIIFQGIGTLWFLPLVYFLDVIYILFNKKYVYILILNIFGILLFFVSNYLHMDYFDGVFKILLVLIRMLVSLPFYYFGVLLNKLMKKNVVSEYINIIFLITFILWIINVVLLRAHQIDLYSLRIKSICQFYINAILACIFIYILCYKFLNFDSFVGKLYGGESLLFMVFNNLSINVLISYIFNVLFRYKSFFIDCLSTLVVSTALVIAFKKFTDTIKRFKLNKVQIRKI